MMIYPREDERAIRLQRMVDDWTKSGLLQPEQRERMQADLAVDYRRTNRFLRITLFLFGFLIINALVGLFAVMLDAREGFGFVLLIAAAGVFVLAQWVIERYRLYRFGIEEAIALSAVPFFGAGLHAASWTAVSPACGCFSASPARPSSSSGASRFSTRASRRSCSPASSR